MNKELELTEQQFNDVTNKVRSAAKRLNFEGIDMEDAQKECPVTIDDITFAKTSELPQADNGWGVDFKTTMFNQEITGAVYLQEGRLTSLIDLGWADDINDFL